MEVGTKVIAKDKDGNAIEGTFVSSKSGWIVVMLKDGTEKKFRSKDVEEKLTKAEAKRREREAAKAAKAAEAPADGEEIDAEGKLVNPDLSRYTLHETVTASGRKHIDIDDDVAKILREKTLDEVYSYVAKVCDVTIKSLKERYENLNLGMQRMNLGNKLRAAMRAAAESSKDVADMKGNKKAPAKKADKAPAKKVAAKKAPANFVSDAGAAVVPAAA
jgi:hypothetical protein